MLLTMVLSLRAVDGWVAGAPAAGSHVRPEKTQLPIASHIFFSDQERSNL
jgi:hypothetical protein